MIKSILKSVCQYVLMALVILAAVDAPAQQKARAHKNRGNSTEKTTPTATVPGDGPVIGKKILLADGSVIAADEVAKIGADYWYRNGGLTKRVAGTVKSVEAVHAPVEKPGEDQTAKAEKEKKAVPESFWVMLKGGARMKVDDVNEEDDGAWCRRGNFSFLIARERIDRIERDSTLTVKPGWKTRDWTTGNPRVDQLIKVNGNRFGVDPYLVFCVIEHESHFDSHAISPKGARGLMQLMPGTAARFGVTNSFDPAQNVLGGTRYLKELLTMFDDRVDLALASYNAGEGAVLKYGSNIPPYRETREYVKRIGSRYGIEPKQSRKATSASN